MHHPNTRTWPERRRLRKMGKVQGLRRGVLTLELVLVLPIILLVLLAIVQFSTYLMAIQTIQAAALVGAREAALPGASNDNVRAAVDRALTGWRFHDDVLADSDGIVIDWQDTAVSVTVRVEASKATINTLAHLAGIGLEGRFISAQYVMRRE